MSAVHDVLRGAKTIRLTRRESARWVQITGFEPEELVASPPPVTSPGGGIKGKRKSKKDKLREAAGLPPGTPLNGAFGVTNALRTWHTEQFALSKTRRPDGASASAA